MTLPMLSDEAGDRFDENENPETEWERMQEAYDAEQDRRFEEWHDEQAEARLTARR